MSRANPGAATNAGRTPYRAAPWEGEKKKKVVGAFYFFILFYAALNSAPHHQTLRYCWNGESWWRTRQPEYIDSSGVVRTKSRPAAREDGWKRLARLHTSTFLAGLRRSLRKKERKLFIGLVPSVFLWNVIITQAGLIYCIYRQRAGVAGAYYLSIFSQLNIWRKPPNTTAKSARVIKSGFLALNLSNKKGKGTPGRSSSAAAKLTKKKTTSLRFFFCAH